MLAAVGMPLLIEQYDGDPAVVAAIGMLAGFCGTLMTPMAANFNLVPSALLELKNPYGVIKAQIGTAVPLLAANIIFIRSEEHTSELQSLMRNSYAVFCLKKNKPP